MAMIGRSLRSRVRNALGAAAELETLGGEIERLQLAVGRLESRAVRIAQVSRIGDAEFRVFSQFGEDGIIQYLIGHIPITDDSFIEFGVEDYRESNTRFLASNDNWRGLILDAGTSHIEFLRTNPIGWRHSIEAKSVFITRDNINATIANAGFRGDIGLLSIDLDGNDYWILEAIDVVAPRILIIEYNSTFGPDAAVSVPYDPRFERTVAHTSNLYWGASLAAVCQAASAKGLAFVGSNTAGNNAFFVRQDLLGDLPNPTPSVGWVDARFRESRDESGSLTFVDGRGARLASIADLPLVTLPEQGQITVGSLLQSGIGR